MDSTSQNTLSGAPPQGHPEPPQPYYVQHQFGGPGELTTTLVHALADVAGVDVTQAELKVGDYLDTDALNRLFEPALEGIQQPNGHINFIVWDHQITVYYDGQIVITPPAQPQPTRR